MPHHLDDMRCKHCGALIALIARASIKNQVGVECGICKVVTILWPIERQALTIKVNEFQPSQ